MGRELAGVDLVVSDYHGGLVKAVQQQLQGDSAAWCLHRWRGARGGIVWLALVVWPALPAWRDSTSSAHTRCDDSAMVRVHAGRYLLPLTPVF